MKAKNNTRRHELGLEQTNARGVASAGKCASSSMDIRGPNVANREESQEGLMHGNCAEGSEESRPCRLHLYYIGNIIYKLQSALLCKEHTALPMAPRSSAFPGVSSSEREARLGFHSLSTASVLDRRSTCGRWGAPETYRCLDASRFLGIVVPSP